MPTKAAEILDMLGVSQTRRTFADAVYGVDHTYGTSTWSTSERGEYGTIFPPLVGEMEGRIERQRTKKGKVQRKEEKRDEKEFAKYLKGQEERED